MKTINISDDALDGWRRLNVLAQCQTCKSWFIPGHGTEDGTGRRLCPECQPVALEAPALTREWLEKHIYLGLGLDPENGRPLPIASNRIRDLVDHLYGNLAMMSTTPHLSGQQAQAVPTEQWLRDIITSLLWKDDGSLMLSVSRVVQLARQLHSRWAIIQEAQGVEPLDEPPGKSKLTLEHLDRLPRVEAESAVFTLNKPVVQRLARSLGIEPEPPPEDRPQTVICQLCGDSITAEQWRYDRCPSPDAAPRPKDEYVEAEVHTRHSHAITETQAALLGLKKEE